MPGMPDGKPAGVRCIHLSGNNLCLLFDSPTRPEVCKNFRPSREICGETREEGLAILSFFENVTAPQ